QSGFKPVDAVDYIPSSSNLDPTTLLRRDVTSASALQHDHTSKNVMNLAHKIGKTLLASEDANVIVYSPVSIAGALQLVLLGSNGETYNELLQLLSVDDPRSLHKDFGDSVNDLLATSVDDVNGGNERTNTITTGAGSLDHRVSIVNGIFVQNGFSIRPDYRSVVESIYRSEITELDFENHPDQAASFINDWVEKSTNGKVKNIVSESLSTDTRVIIASTLYFNSRWKDTFIEGGTKRREFYPDGLSGRHIMVDMMSFGGRLPYYYAREYNCQIIGVPYKNNLSTFYIIVPDDSNAFKLRQLQKDLTPDKIDYMISKMTLNTSILLLPKMHLTSEFKLKEVLSQLGVRTLFDEHLADLSLITDQDIYGKIGKLVPSALTQAGGNAASNHHHQYENREDFLIFSRLRGDDDEDHDEMDMHNVDSHRRKRATYKVASKFDYESEPLTLKDFVLRKRITKPHAEKKLSRSRRQVSDIP
uniref:Serpin domain-containing protein n=1 Tax=Phlebotomus papatasi TaxID=29031 RepID=A0A1B0DJV5_PHLPP